MNNSSPNNQELVNLLSTYFSQRGKFLAKVIKADLKNASLSKSSDRFDSSLIQLNYSEQSQQHNFNLAANSLEVTTTTTELEIEITNNSDATTDSIEKILVNLIVEQTGYPPESIELNAKLLDDLNLDSIKSAEVVAQTAKQIGLEGEIDPSLFANATLQEVIATLQEIKEKGFSANNSSFVDVSSEAVASWVRNYVIEYVPESINEDKNSDSDSVFSLDDWVNSEVLIVGELPHQAWTESLTEELLHKGAQVETVDLEQLETLNSDRYTHIIAFLPTTQENIAPEAKLEKAIRHLRTVGAFPAEKTDEYTNVSFIQFGDGYFGKGELLGDIDTHCTIGFAASLHLERADLKVRVVDLPFAIEADLLAETVIEEIACADPYLAVGYDAELTRYIPRPLLQDRSTYQNRNLSWSSKDVVLVTGGAKGITAECIFAWAQETEVALALVGSSPDPQDVPDSKSSREIAATLNRFEEANLNCRYYQCDVSDLNALSNLVTKIEGELGAVTGVIHGAAINRAKPVNKSTIDDAIAEVKPKVVGAINLATIFQAKPLKLFAGFSSIGAVVGLPGNTWYSFSNEALNLILRQYQQQHPSTEIICLAYSVWSEVGMGAKMGAVSGLARMGIGAISLQEGVERFVQLMAENPGDTQVVIAARIDERIALQHNFDTWLPPRLSPPEDCKFLEKIVMHEPGVETIVRTHLDLTKDSYVKDHIYNGSYLFPTVFGLEAMAQTVAHTLQMDGFSSLILENIRLERPIVVHPENGVEIEIHAEVSEKVKKSDPIRVHVEIKTESTGFTKAHFAADFVLNTEIATTNYQTPQSLNTLDIEPKQDLYGWLLFQGAKFQRIQELYSLDSQQMIFLTEKQQFAMTDSPDRSDGPFLLGDPYYRDSLLHSVQPIVPEDLCLPLGIERMEIHLTSQSVENYCIGIAQREETKDEQHDTTVIAVNRNGQIIEKLSGYQLKIMEHIADNPTAEELVNPEARDNELLYRELSQRASTLGIIPPEVTIAHLPGLHELSTEERHQLELPLFSETVHKLIEKLD